MYEELDQYLLDLMYSLADLDVYLSLLDKHGGGGGGQLQVTQKTTKKQKKSLEFISLYIFNLYTNFAKRPG